MRKGTVYNGREAFERLVRDKLAAERSEAEAWRWEARSAANEHAAMVDVCAVREALRVALKDAPAGLQPARWMVGRMSHVFERPPRGKAWFIPVLGERGPFLADVPTHAYVVSFPDWDAPAISPLRAASAGYTYDLPAIPSRAFEPLRMRHGYDEWNVYFEVVR